MLRVRTFAAPFIIVVVVLLSCFVVLLSDRLSIPDTYTDFLRLVLLGPRFKCDPLESKKISVMENNGLVEREIITSCQCQGPSPQ